MAVVNVVSFFMELVILKMVPLAVVNSFTYACQWQVKMLL